MEVTPYRYEELEAFANHIKQKIDIEPVVGIIAGSGQGALADTVENQVVIPYKDIPNFPVSTVSGHKGQFVIGTLNGKPVVVMSGRFHFYEGYPPYKLIAPVRVMALLGIKCLIACNAAGGINRDFKIGDFMLLKDHIGFPIVSGYSPLRGPNDDPYTTPYDYDADTKSPANLGENRDFERCITLGDAILAFGPRFVNMSDVYSLRLRTLARSVAEEEGLSHFMREGIYLMASGPTYETPAELRFFRTVGADVVGMSTVPEAIAARHCGVEVLGMSLVTNACIMENDLEQKTNHKEVLEVGKSQGSTMCRLIGKIVEKMDFPVQNGV